MSNFSVTKNGQPLDPKLYTWDEETKTFSSKEEWLVLDFTDIDGVTFKTGPSCTFNTGYSCTFNTGYSCTFKTGPSCTFDTGSNCTFKTGFGCTFDTGYSCTFDTGFGCTFKTESNCVIIRRDIFEVIILKDKKNHIKLNRYKEPGYIDYNTEKTKIRDIRLLK